MLAVMQSIPRRSSRSTRPDFAAPKVRKGVLRIPFEIAHRLRAGHPFVYRETLGARPFPDKSGDVVDVVDEEGIFVGRGLYDTEGNVAVRIWTRDADERIDSTAFSRRIKAAKTLRDAYLQKDDTTTLSAFRVLHGEGDFLPGVVVDKYADYLLITLFSGSLVPHIDTLCNALDEVWHPKGIYLQKRLRSQTGEGAKEPAELVRGQIAPVEIEVQEGSLRFLVDVTAPLGTGLFPDLRLGRQLIATRSKGKRVLNLFSYAGAISLHAALGGATSVVSVDLAAKAHARARKNLKASNLPDSNQEFITGDVFAVLTRMKEDKRMFDVVVVDPPPFSQAQGKVFNVQKDYAHLIADALSVCAPSSMLYCCSNAVKFSREEMEETIGEASRLARRHIRMIEEAGLPCDFPVPAGFSDGHYLKCFGYAVI